MLTFFKPTKSVKGCLLSISFSAKADKFENNKLVKGDKSFYWSFVAQTGWVENGPRGNGSFKDGKKIIVKMSPNEVAGIIAAVNRNTTLAEAMATEYVFHDSPIYGLSIVFGPYFKKVKDGDVWKDSGKQLGFSIRITKTQKADKNQKESLGLAFTYAETELLVNYLKEGLISIFHALKSEDVERGKKFAEKKAAEPINNEPVVEETDSPPIDNDESW